MFKAIFKFLRGLIHGKSEEWVAPEKTETIREILTPEEAPYKLEPADEPVPAPIPDPRVRVTSDECLKRFGDPARESSMVLLDVPPLLEVGALPNRIYCNKLIKGPLLAAFQNIVDRGLTDQVKTWDGCFNIRRKKGGLSPSLHSWGMAIDMNAAWNGFNKQPTMSKELVACFTEEGFAWGGEWSRPDGMHFELEFFP